MGWSIVRAFHTDWPVAVYAILAGWFLYYCGERYPLGGKP
jgi:hypothetical protein